MNKTESIAVIMVNFNTAELVLACLSSLMEQRKEFPNLFVVVVDNQSTDDSVEVLHGGINRSLWSDWVSVIEAEYNGGFSYGNNRGFEYALSLRQDLDFFWMLNPDTVVLPGAVKPLLEEIGEDASIIAGSALYDIDGQIQVSAFRFPCLLNEVSAGLGSQYLDYLLQRYRVMPKPSEQLLKPDWLSGASLMFRTEILKKMGQFDENYFLYFEEVDFMYAATRKSISCSYVPDSQITHYKGVSTRAFSTAQTGLGEMPGYWFDSRRRYFVKHHGLLYFLLADITRIIGYATRLLKYKITGSRKLASQRPRFLQGLIRGSLFNPYNWSNPSNEQSRAK